jgi:hypothetical protein
MPHSILDEPLETIRDVARAILNYQGCYFEKEKLKRQLDSAAVNTQRSTGTIVFFEIPGVSGSDDIYRSLDVEASILDASGNKLHAILFVDHLDNILALEIFPWENWVNELDVKSMEPIRFDEDGISRPS